MKVVLTRREKEGGGEIKQVAEVQSGKKNGRSGWPNPYFPQGARGRRKKGKLEKTVLKRSARLIPWAGGTGRAESFRERTRIEEGR